VVELEFNILSEFEQICRANW